MSQRKPISILLVDDDDADRELYRSYLEDDPHTPYRVFEATNGAEALVAAVDAQPDCILVDFHLPDADGLDILDRLDRVGMVEDTAVIMLTGHGDERICAAAMKKGAMDYARKSDLTAAGLTNIIHYAVERSCLRRELRDKQEAIEHHARELAMAKQALESTVEQLRQSNHELEAAQEKSRYELTHDDLTGLPNRCLLQQQIADSIRHADRYDQSVAVMHVNLSSFARIHEALGAVGGDDLICQTADRLSAAVRASDVVGRVGTHEFVVLLRSLSAPDHARVVARKLIDVISEPHHTSGGRIPAAWRVGIALYPRDARDPETLLLRAHTAMCESAADDQTGLCFYDAEMNELAQSELVLEGRLREGVARDELALVYQPLLSLPDRRLTGVEALLRWRHPTRGWLYPGQFLPLAAKSSLIVEIGDWVLRRALDQLRSWQSAGLPPVPLAINVSRRELRSPDFADRVTEHAFDRGIPLEQIRCELSEADLGAETPWAYDQAYQLKDMGVGISLDDFGMTHASLRTLEKLPVDTVKLDRRFVAHAHENKRTEAVVSAMLTLARSLSLDTVAVGIEDLASLDLFEQQGCTHAQGYALSQPLPPDELLRWASAIG